MHRNAGFSLVEIMCAILVLGIALVGLTEGITNALSSARDSELQTAAALVAAGQIETLLAEGYVVDGDTEGECGEVLPLYRWKQSITSTSINGLHEVEVVVENSRSAQAVYELRTLLFDPPGDTTWSGSAARKDSDRTGRKGGKRR